ncbi:MAG: ABC transporter substrate-binding protein [Acidimicrobiia bacterium]
MTLPAALVTPLTGPLAGYGRAGATALGLWARTSRQVELIVVDAFPDAAAAMRRAEALGPQLIFGPYGSSPARAAIGATRRLVWNHGGATSALARSQYPNAVNVPAPASTYFTGVLRAVRRADPDARRVVLHQAATGFAEDVARGASAEAAASGFDVTDDVGSEGEVLLVVGGFEYELAAARTLLHRPWRAAAFVGAGVEEVLEELGPAREGLVGPAQWMASAALPPEEGPDTAWFCDAWRRRAGTEPPYPAVQAFAAGVVCARCLRDAGSTDDAALLDAARRLDTSTLYGRFRLDPVSGLQAGHEVLTVQWQEGARRVVWPPERAEAPLRYPRDDSMP